MDRASRRTRRVGDAIRKEIGLILLAGVKDPRVASVVITDLELSKDLRSARVFFSLIGDLAARKRAQEGLESAAGFIKREINSRLDLRYVPDLRFVFDESLERGARISGILSDVLSPAVEPGGKE